MNKNMALRRNMPPPNPNAHLVLAHAEDVAVDLIKSKVVGRHRELRLALRIRPAVPNAARNAARPTPLPPPVAVDSHLNDLQQNVARRSR